MQLQNENRLVCMCVFLLTNAFQDLSERRKYLNPKSSFQIWNKLHWLILITHFQDLFLG